MIKTALAVTLVFAISGCVPVQPALTKEQFKAHHPDYSNQTVDDLFNGIVRVGMTSEQVLYSWGRPNDTTRSVGANGSYESWWWGTYQRVGLRDGIVVDITTRN